MGDTIKNLTELLYVFTHMSNFINQVKKSIDSLEESVEKNAKFINEISFKIVQLNEDIKSKEEKNELKFRMLENDFNQKIINLEEKIKMNEKMTEFLVKGEKLPTNSIEKNLLEKGK